jgi:Pyruvate/2-oxoacid:ferredoxin oxidoreductase gamma subunit
MATDIQISIVGSAGDGTIAAGEILRNALAGMGYKVISFDVYPPEIRGFGKCIARMRITTEQAYSLKHKSDVMVSLDDSHAIPHANEVRECGAVIYEQGSIVRLPEGGHMSAHVGPGAAALSAADPRTVGKEHRRQPLAQHRRARFHRRPASTCRPRASARPSARSSSEQGCGGGGVGGRLQGRPRLRRQDLQARRRGASARRCPRWWPAPRWR